MRILKGMVFIVMLVGVVTYWMNRGPRQQIDLASTAEQALESDPKDPLEFSLVDRSGRPVKLSEFQGKPIVLNFWASWCPPCLEEMPGFLKFAEWAKTNLGVETLAVSVDPAWAPVNRLFAEKKLWPRSTLPLTILLDADSKVASAYGSSKFPETFFINRNFKIIRKFVGVQDWMSQEITKWVTVHSK